MARVQVEGLEIRQREYQDAMNITQRLQNPPTQRDIALISASHDALSEHPDRCFESIQLFHGSLCSIRDVGFVALKVGISKSPVSLRVLLFADVDDFKIDKSMVIGIWGSRIRLSRPTSDNLASSWRD